jgi:glutathione S-transferase
MKLYFSPSACSLAPHIALREAGLPVTLDRVHLGSKRTASGTDFRAVSAKGYVPALELDDGRVLTEGLVILQYIADLAPESGLAPPPASFERYRLQEWLTFVSSELHKGLSALFKPRLPVEWKPVLKRTLGERLGVVDAALAATPYLMGSTFTVADAYLFTVLRWTHRLEIDLTPWPALVSYVARVAERPAVKEALAAEADAGPVRARGER